MTVAEGHIAHGPQVPLKQIPLVVGEPRETAFIGDTGCGKPLTFHSAVSTLMLAPGYGADPFLQPA